MQRRTLLGVVGTVATAGCVSERTDPEPGLADTTFTLQQRGSGSQSDEARVVFDGTTIEITGTIWGANGCRTAELASATYEPESDALTVAVAETIREGAQRAVCTQAIVSVSYQATVTFENGLPGTVIVTHNHGDGPTKVTSASP